MLARVFAKATAGPIVAFLAYGQDEGSHRKIGCRHCQNDGIWGGLEEFIHKKPIIAHPTDLSGKNPMDH